MLAILAICAAAARGEEPSSAAFALPAGAPPLFLVDSQFDDGPTRILRLDTATGSLTAVADLGTEWTPVLGLAAADASTFFATGTDNSGAGSCAADGACVLLRITVPGPSIEPIGLIRRDGVVVKAITGLTFGADGRLYASSQETDSLYIVDPVDATATLLGTVDLDLHGGDLTFAADGRLWIWSNLGPASGIYEITPDFTHASAFLLFPSRALAGLSAPGRGHVLVGAHAPGDLVYLLDTQAGQSSDGLLLTLDGLRFDFERGDLDSPWCADAAACHDDDLCTTDACTPGGCRSTPLPVDDGDACTADSCDPLTGPRHDSLLAIDTDGDQVPDCLDRCPATPSRTAVNRDGCSPPPECPCDGPWSNHGEYVSCVAKAAARLAGTGRGAWRAGHLVREAARSSCGR